MSKFTRTHWEVVAAFALGTLVSTFLLIVAPRTSARPVLHTKVGPLVTELQTYMEQKDICVAVGRGFKCAPIRVDFQCMTQDQRSGWWDKHQDSECRWVVVLMEGTRAESPVDPRTLPAQDGGPEEQQEEKPIP